MKRICLAITLALLATPLARAHFVWIVPDGNGGAKVVFSDSLEPDDNVPIDKISQTKLWLRPADGEPKALDWKKGDAALLVATTGSGQRELAGMCRYGVLTRGDKAFALFYYAKYLPADLGKARPWDLLTLDVLPLTAGKFQVQFQGKPVKGAEVVAILPDGKKLPALSTDANGEVAIDTKTPGLYGLRARHLEARAGNTDAGKFEEVRHYSTLVFSVAKAGADAGRVTPPVPALKDDAADPAATRLLADARAARATWPSFPGFSAQIEVNLDGKVEKGKVTVDADGKVKIEGVDKDHETWARRTLLSVAAHRISNAASLETPCAFADRDEHHPLGRMIKVLNDELHSSYRIRDRQIMVVNRTTPESRFSITMQENRLTPEGKYLPASFVVHHWDKSGALAKTESNLQTWVREAGFDLPQELRVITATKELSTRSLRLTNHALLRTAAK